MLPSSTASQSTLACLEAPSSVTELIPSTRRLRLNRLREQLDHAAPSETLRPRHPCVPCPVAELAPFFPEGLELGTFIEIVSAPGGGAYRLALALAASALAAKPAWAVVDSAGTFYPPALSSLKTDTGLELRHLILIRTGAEQASHAAWACGQLMRSAEIGACFWSTPQLDNMLFRRLQLAAERGGGLTFLLRPPAVKHKPCWGSARLGLKRTATGRYEVTLLYARRQPVSGQAKVELAL